MDLEDKNQTKVTQISGAVFKGFDENVLEEVYFCEHCHTPINID